MLVEEDNTTPLPPPPPVAAGGDDRKTYSRSVSWAIAGISPVKPNPKIPKSLWLKARSCLPPLSVSRPKADEWPKAGSDDLGIWPNIAATPRSVSKPAPLPVNVDRSRFEFKKDKLAYFDKECSRIIDHVFLGSDSVAKNREVLCRNGITHVLNCVGFVCPEYFKKDFVYRTLWIRDSPNEDITSILYDVFDYFEDVREEKGRIFVHCCQGVSRSSSLVIAYLMWSEGWSFEESFRRVKAARGVTNPNMGFACQLLQCQKRVHAVPVSPDSALRMFRIAPYSSYSPLHLVPKLLTEPNANALDSRGAFIVHVPNNVYMWVGKSCVSLMFESASLAAARVIRYEKAIGPVLRIIEGEEPADFWWAISSVKEHEMEVRGGLGERRVVDYDLDFEIFDRATNGGVVPPLAITSNHHEMCLPARQSGWERLRKRSINGVVKELVTMDRSHKELESSSDLFSFLVKRFKKVD
ncbi:protein-tyrosine-phosphatase MKP1-like [Cynara cardunculus var. scolymus]|uniref:Dual specificity phosphatase n=1 Tax=Cynara cardunculus var. scolymus TaxID=59895 RepID=A0A103YAT8_CYNCS|nr:protein-tyrosine-phosphatase MKP1-like [Cynara cardunculus var. scolymus]KVI05680.1 Dual specificity phosphatase [Cynara cardunculus var. scolymus]